MPTIETPSPGHHPEMSNDAYHGSDGISKSHLDDIAGLSPLHYFHKRVDPDREPEEKTPALVFGDALHKAVLEPDLLESNFITAPADAPKRPSSKQRTAKKPSIETLEAIDFWDAFAKKAAGKTVLDMDDLTRIKKARDAVHRHPIAGPLLRGGQSEQTFFAICPRTGALIKARTDYLKPGMIVDLKSTEDASPESFGKSSYNFRYDVQAAWYPYVTDAAGWEAIEHFVFVAVEKVEPFACGIYYAAEEVLGWNNIPTRPLDDARFVMHQNLDLILECRARNHWPDYAMNPQALQHPGWARRRAA